MKLTFFSLNSYLFFSFLLFSNISFSQKEAKENPDKFGNLTAADFQQSLYSIDSSASAIVLADKGSTTFSGNNKGWFDYIFKRYTRIKILNKRGYDASKIAIELYKSDSKRAEVLSDLKATTSNMDDGKIVIATLDNNDVYDERSSKNHITKKFALPAVKEGSIIEISYTITSPFDFNVQNWFFQSTEYPKLWSEYKISIPAMLGYYIVKHGIDSFFTKKNTETYENFSVKESYETKSYSTRPDQTYSVNTTVKNYEWAMKNIPALKIENYISTPGNYIDELEFQLSKVYDGESTNDYFATWETASQSLLLSLDFGSPIEELVNAPAIDNAAGNGTDKYTIARNIYYYIKDNFTCTDHNYFYVNTNLWDMVQKHAGNVGEINLLLINKLRKFGIDADPVILSTRGNGFTFDKIPILSKYNYLICKATINGNIYYLDASHPNLGFGKLTNETYNGNGRIISQTPGIAILSTDSLNEKSTTVATINNGDKGMESSFTIYSGYIKSYELRNEIGAGSDKEYFDKIKNNFTIPAEISNTNFTGLSNLEDPVTIKYDASFNLGDDDIIYFDPILSGKISINPFAAATRFYPVEMPYKADDSYILTMETPKGYIIDEMPKSTRVMLNEVDGMFEYIVQKTETGLQMRCRIQFNKANFSPEDYNSLRDFYSYIVKKESEQIVFKKLK